MAALAFLRWFQTYDAQVVYAKAGQPPIRKDVYDAPFMKTPEFRWAHAVAESTPNAKMMYTVPEGPQIVSILELRLNQAMIGEKTSARCTQHDGRRDPRSDAKAGYKTGRLPDLE